MNPVLQVVLVVLVVGLSVWLRVVRPLRADLAAKRQGERVARARASRLARRRAKAPASGRRAAGVTGAASGSTFAE